MKYRLRPLTFSLQSLASFTPGLPFDTEVLASVETVTNPYVIVSGSVKDGKSLALDATSFNLDAMGMTEYEGYKKLSLMPVTDDNDGVLPNINPMLSEDLINYEINAPKVILSGITLTQFPIVHILERIQ